MTDREFFVETLEDEAPRFERLLRALPEEKLDYKHDEKSRTALELTAMMADESEGFAEIIEQGVLDVGKPANVMPTSPSHAADTMIKNLKQALELAKASSEEVWDSSAQMKLGDKVEWETTRGKMAWGLVFDLIHHRGQLATYIRPMGGKVPPIYGPSADSRA